MYGTQEQGYALVDYDVHQTPTYAVIYKHLGGIAVRFTESVYLIREAFMNVVEVAFSKINEELRERGLEAVDFNVTPVAGKAIDLMRRRSIKSLNAKVREIGASLLGKIERLEDKFDDVTGDVNKHLYRTRLAIAQAKRDVIKARGLATMFIIEGDAQAAIDATVSIIEAEGVKRAITKAEAKAAKVTA